MSLRRVVINGHAFLTLLSIFRIPWSWLRIKFRNERGVRDSAHVWARSLRSLVIHVHSTFAMQFFFLYFFFLCDQEISNYKFQKTLRSKKEDRREPTNCCEEGCNEQVLIFWIFFGVQRMGSHCYYYITVLLSILIVVVLFDYLHADPSS